MTQIGISPVVILRRLVSVFPDPVGSLPMMTRTFFNLLKVTKKTVQSNYLRKLQMKNLETQHCSFLIKTMMKNSKSEAIKRHENIESIKKVLMSVTLQDAIDDLRETRESSGIQLQDALILQEEI